MTGRPSKPRRNMATEEIPMPEGPAPVMMSQEDYQKIAEAMITYKAIEQKWLAARRQNLVARRVVGAFVMVSILVFVALWLAFTGWREAAAWGILTFAAGQALVAIATLITEKLRAP